jgi:hypothetical protein
MVQFRSSAADTPAWPEDPFARLDLETWFGCGIAMIGSAALPQGWTLERLEALWRARGADLDPGPDWQAWERWGRPPGARR